MLVLMGCMVRSDVCLYLDDSGTLRLTAQGVSQAIRYDTRTLHAVISGSGVEREGWGESGPDTLNLLPFA